MVSLDLQEEEMEGFRRSQVPGLASLRMSLPPHSQWSKKSQSPLRFKREGCNFHLLKGKAEKEAS